MGTWGRANVYMGDNSQIEIDCNTYNDNVRTDWTILGLGGTAYLANQGECDPSDYSAARRNTFHTPNLTNNDENIVCLNCQGVNSSGTFSNITDFEYIGQPLFNPISVTNVSLPFCSNNIIANQNGQCEYNPDCDPDCLRTAITQSENQQEIISLQTELIHSLLDNQLYEASKSYLQEVNDIEAQRVLTATYESEGKIDSAYLYLEMLPQETEEDIAFYELYQQLLSGIEPPTTGTGKAPSIQEQQLRSMAEETDYKASEALAQAIIAIHYDESFNKNVPVVQKVNETALYNSASLFELYPNPSNNVIQIRFLNPNIKEVQCSIYNLQGALLQSLPLYKQLTKINISDLPTGVYLCKFSNKNGLLDTQKLIVIH